MKLDTVLGFVIQTISIVEVVVVLLAMKDRFGVGAVHIPGTPTDRRDPNFDTNSIMLACFRTSEDGEFSEADLVALQYLYPVFY